MLSRVQSSPARMRKYRVSCFVFAMALVGGIEAAPLSNIAVMPLQAKGVSANDADVITDGVVSRLQQNGSMRVMERSQMDKILKEQGFATSGACDGAECAVEVGKFLAVDRILVGSVGILGRTYTLNLRTVNVSTGEVLKSSLRSRAGNIEDVLTMLVPESVNDLVSAPVVAPPPVAEPKRAVTTESVPAPAPKKKSSGTWGWWVGGGAVIAAGTTAAILLLPKKAAPAGPAEPVVATTTLNTTW